VLPQARVATVVDWAFAPQWLSRAQACFSSDPNRKESDEQVRTMRPPDTIW
jgi:hypothetical protein